MQLASNVVIAERFRLNRQLGRGGMGSVWHATHLGLDIPCAVKFIEGEIAQLPEAQQRFEREAKAAAHLRSPHVVQILDHGVWQGTPYIAMELLEGEDLGKRLLRVGRLPPAEVLKIVGQVCRALTKAHSIGIVHRDLKPDNVFLVHDDDRELAKVLDFGIAKAIGTGLDGSNTKTGAMLGTPYYMSPEQAQGTKAVDHRSDLWSLAVIVFQALTGRLPFESEALGDLLLKIIVLPVPMPSQFVSDLPATFERWWTKASQRDPAQRYQNARELADALAIAFGQSQGMGLTDRGSIRAGAAPDAAMGPPGGAYSTPYQITPGPPFPQATRPMGVTPPGFGSTPQPASQGATPHPFQQQAPATVPTTGGAMSHTFASGQTGIKNRTGMVVAIAAAGLVVVVLGIVGVSFALRGKAPSGASNTEAPSADTTANGAAAVAMPAANAATIASSAVLAPEPTQSAQPTATPPAPVAAGPAAKPMHKPASGTVAPAPAPKPAPTPSATATAKKPRVDLGI